MNYLLMTLIFGSLIFCCDGADKIVRYVDANGANPTPPYTNWATAARTIQDAIDAVPYANVHQILVTNGVYDVGGRPLASGTPTNRVLLLWPIPVQSVNGPEVTIIRGYQVPGTINGPEAVRCVCFVTAGATLSGFTLTGGATATNGEIADMSGGGALGIQLGNQGRGTLSNCVVKGNASFGVGGGAYATTLNRCILRGNSASYGGGGAAGCSLINCVVTENFTAGEGGGTFNCKLQNCLLTHNSALVNGGGADGGLITNCTVVGNSAAFGGGVVLGSEFEALVNSIVYYNIASTNLDIGFDCRCGPPLLLSYCSSAAGGMGFTNEPRFVDRWNGDFRLQANSPCINAGVNVPALVGTDLDGSPRLVGSAVDVGAYEVQNPVADLPYYWLLTYDLPLINSVGTSDPDQDGMNNRQECIAGTNPTNSLSLLKLLSVEKDASGVTLKWQSVSGKRYCVERCGGNVAQSEFVCLATNIQSASGLATYKDTTAAGSGPFFYRVGLP